MQQVVLPNGLTEVEDELFEAHSALRLHLIVHELLLELEQRCVGRVVVQVHRVQDVGVGRDGVLARVDDVLSQDPWQRHTDRELDALSELEVELAVPEEGHIHTAGDVGECSEQVGIEEAEVVEVVPHCDALLPQVLLAEQSSLHARTFLTVDGVQYASHESDLHGAGCDCSEWEVAVDDEGSVGVTEEVE